MDLITYVCIRAGGFRAASTKTSNESSSISASTGSIGKRLQDQYETEEKSRAQREHPRGIPSIFIPAQTC